MGIRSPQTTLSSSPTTCWRTTEFYASPPPQYVIDGKVMRGEKVDDSTVRLIFAGPYLTFPERLAGPLGQHPILYAKHYCSQFMPKYNPDVGKLLAATSQPNWSALFRQHCGDIETPARWANPARPVLDPWVIKVPYTGGATEVVAERNPYFWQVDPAGNQLPYLDAVNFKVISDIQSIVLAAVGGQMDLEVRHVALINNKPVLAQHGKSGHYGLIELDTTDVSSAALFLNQTDKNPRVARAADRPRIPRARCRWGSIATRSTRSFSWGRARPGRPVRWSRTRSTTSSLRRSMSSRISMRRTRSSTSWD